MKLSETIIRMFSESSKGFDIIEPLYHVSNFKFNKFDAKATAQSILWFSSNKDFVNGNDFSGASIRPGATIYLYTCSAKVTKTAGWAEYERYSLMELDSMGYDSIELDEDWVIFDGHQVTIKNIEVIRP